MLVTPTCSTTSNHDVAAFDENVNDVEQARASHVDTCVKWLSKWQSKSWPKVTQIGPKSGSNRVLEPSGLPCCFLDSFLPLLAHPRAANKAPRSSQDLPKWRPKRYKMECHITWWMWQQVNTDFEGFSQAARPSKIVQNHCFFICFPASMRYEKQHKNNTPKGSKNLPKWGPKELPKPSWTSFPKGLLSKRLPNTKWCEKYKKINLYWHGNGKRAWMAGPVHTFVHTIIYACSPDTSTYIRAWVNAYATTCITHMHTNVCFHTCIHIFTHTIINVTYPCVNYDCTMYMPSCMYAHSCIFWCMTRLFIYHPFFRQTCVCVCVCVCVCARLCSHHGTPSWCPDSELQCNDVELVVICHIETLVE